MATIQPGHGQDGSSEPGSDVPTEHPQETPARSTGSGLTAADYLRIRDSEEFQTLRTRFRRFVFPMTAAFLGWYLLFVLASSYAQDFMATKVVGNINVALIFGLLQFVSTFLIAWYYSRYATTHFDPIADELKDRIEGGRS